MDRHCLSRVASTLSDTPLLQETHDAARALLRTPESGEAKKADADKLVLGECEKVQAKNKWAINYDFTITLFKKNLVGLSADQIRIVMFHELLHVGIEPGPEGDEIYSVRKHDLEDFKLIIDKYGTDWSKAARKEK